MSGNGKPHPKKKAMLAALSETGNVTRAAEIASIDRCTHYKWLHADPEYVVGTSDAMEQAVDHLETEARRRAVEGVPEPLMYQGENVGTIQRYSDTLLIFLLKGCRPEKYADRQKVQHSGRIETEPIDAILADREVALALHRAAATKGRETFDAPGNGGNGQ